MVEISKEELDKLKMKAELDDELLVKLVKSLEDIILGNFRDWDEVKASGH